MTYTGDIIESSYLPATKSAQQAELIALAQACQLAKDQIATIYTDSSCTFGVARDFGILRQQWGFLPLWDNLPKKKMVNKGFPGGSVVKIPPASAGDIVRSLIWEDCTCRGAAKPVHHSCEPGSRICWAHGPQPLKPARPGACALQQEKPPQWEALALLPESSPTRHN